MDSKKALPYLRKILLTTIAFWGYILICNVCFIMVEFFYVSLDTLDTPTVTVPQNVSGWQTVICYAAFIPLFYDFLVCDRVSQNEYVRSIQALESFSYKNEIKGLIRNTDFLFGSATLVFWSLIATPMFSVFLDCFGVPADLNSFYKRLIVLVIFTLPAVLMYAVASVMSRRRWFSSKGCYNPDEAVKSIYALKLLKNTVIWIVDFLLAVYLIFIARYTVEPLNRGLGRYYMPAIKFLAVLAVALFFYRRIRALIKQYLFIKKLKTFCKDNKLNLRLPQSPYFSVLKQEVQSFSVSNKLMTFNCLLVPSVIRKIPLYFKGDNEIIRAHTYYFFKIALFTTTKTVSYSFNELPENIPQNNIIVISPIPREIFIGAVGNAIPADNGSETSSAVIYSGSALCNYISRLLDNEKYILEKKNTRFNKQF